MALVPCIIPFQPSWFPLQITQRCRWDAWSLCIIVVPQQAYETFHLLPRAPADSLGPAWPSDKHSPEVQVNLPGSPPLMGECQLPVLCLDNSGRSQPVWAPVTSSGPLSNGPSHCSVLLSYFILPTPCPCFLGSPAESAAIPDSACRGGGGTQDSWHSLFQFIVAHRKFMYFFKLFFLRFSHCLVFSSFLRMCV